MKIGKDTLIFFVALLVIVLLLNILLLRFDKFKQLDEYLYFSSQIIKANKKSRIQLFNTAESHCDSLIDYITIHNDPEKFFLINLPKVSEKKLPENVFLIYDLYDEMDYTSFNIKFNTVVHLRKLASYLGSTTTVYDNAYISYTGDHNSFDLHYLLSYDSLNYTRSGIILIGYAGEHFDPHIQKDRVDSAEMWFTPKFEMYDLVLKGNVIENILNDEFVYKVNGTISFITCLMMIILLYGYLYFYHAKPYWMYKLFQLVLLLILIITTFLFINIGIFIPFTLLLLVVVLVGEIIYWSKRRLFS